MFVVFVPKVVESKSGQLIEIFCRSKFWFSFLVSKSVLELYFCSDFVPITPTDAYLPKLWPGTLQVYPSVSLLNMVAGVCWRTRFHPMCGRPGAPNSWSLGFRFQRHYVWISPKRARKYQRWRRGGCKSSSSPFLLNIWWYQHQSELVNSTWGALWNFVRPMVWCHPCLSVLHTQDSGKCARRCAPHPWQSHSK